MESPQLAHRGFFTEVPFLEPAGWGTLIAGLVALGLAGLLTFLGLRSPSRETVAA